MILIVMIVRAVSIQVLLKFVIMELMMTVMEILMIQIQTVLHVLLVMFKLVEVVYVQELKPVRQTVSGKIVQLTMTMLVFVQYVIRMEILFTMERKMLIVMDKILH